MLNLQLQFTRSAVAFVSIAVRVPAAARLPAARLALRHVLDAEARHDIVQRLARQAVELQPRVDAVQEVRAAEEERELLLKLPVHALQEAVRAEHEALQELAVLAEGVRARVVLCRAARGARGAPAAAAATAAIAGCEAARGVQRLVLLLGVRVR